MSQKEEKKLQKALIKEVSKLLPTHPHLALLYHVPNGELRDAKVAVELKRMGVLKGIPDLHLPIARQGYVGLWLELKTADGKESAYQLAIARMLTREGHLVKTARSVEEGIDTLKWYVNG